MSAVRIVRVVVLGLLGLATASCDTGLGRLGALPDAGVCAVLRVPSGGALRLDPNATANTEFTFEAWVRVDGPGDTPFGRLFGVEETGACAPANALPIWSVGVDAGGAVVVRITDTPRSTFMWSGAPVQAPVGTFFHVALQYDGAGRGRLFVDGQPTQEFLAVPLRDPLPDGCPITLGAAPGALTERQPMTLLRVRHTLDALYPVAFTPDAALPRVSRTTYRFSFSDGTPLPLTDGSTQLTGLGAQLDAAPGACP